VALTVVIALVAAFAARVVLTILAG
jgi:hypothetical protein